MCLSKIHEKDLNFYNARILYIDFFEEDSYYEVCGFQIEKYNLAKSLEKKDLITFKENLTVIQKALEEILLEVVIKYYEEFNKL